MKQIKRKILGYKYSCLVTLPKYWIAFNDLKRRDEITLEIQENGDLLVKARKNVNKT